MATNSLQLKPFASTAVVRPHGRTSVRGSVQTSIAAKVGTSSTGTRRSAMRTVTLSTTSQTFRPNATFVSSVTSSNSSTTPTFSLIPTASPTLQSIEVAEAAPPSTNMALPIAAIVGIVIGAIVFVLLKAGCMFYIGLRYRRWRARKHEATIESGVKQELDGFSVDSGSRDRRDRAVAVTEFRQELPGDFGAAVGELPDDEKFKHRVFLHELPDDKKDVVIVKEMAVDPKS
ncbi:hypothetical protein BDV95DRAFT_606717 [Massariosphaeria phaeospora]|uniref:Uncharacterized protein n=1 Tax=Massariosphaeria phaeospora TaxID=100035 RepID=A0A7C8M8S0_9PLEO|nr:hypothetical protein BDV95DRAFT_606717 [Massariosphaeria phaeospora]